MAPVPSPARRRLYRFDPKHAQWTVYALPPRGTYAGEITFARSGDVCTSSNPLPASAPEGGAAELIGIDARRPPLADTQMLQFAREPWECPQQ